MYKLEFKKALVVGLGVSGRAAVALLRRLGASVTAVDESQSPELERQAVELRAVGVPVELGCRLAPQDAFDLVVVSPGVPLAGPFMTELKSRNIPIIGELELAYQQSYCLNIAVSGTNGKTTTTELINHMINHSGRKSLACGNIGVPFSDCAEETKGLDFVTLEVSSYQLEAIHYFRPSVAVLMNITPDHLDRYASMDAYARTKGQLFRNQMSFDWAVIQSEAFNLLKKLEVEVPSKVITFSAVDKTADIFLERGLLLSRMPEWPGPLFDMEQGSLVGPHNAENLMATLAVGRILRIPLEQIVEALCSYTPAAHRCETIAEIGGVRYVNDSKATNLDAVQKAIQAMPGNDQKPNVWLIAGGKDKGFEFHDIGPLLTQRVKGAFLIGETREKIRAAWSLFTPCTLMNSLLEAVQEAAHQALPGDVVLLSPACSSFDQFQNYQHRGEVFRQAVLDLPTARQTSGTSDDALPDSRSMTG